MLRLEFTRQEVDDIKSKIYLSEMQERIFEYRLKEYSITKMSMLENVSESTISRELKKVKKKIMKVIWQFSNNLLIKNSHGLKRIKFFFYVIIKTRKEITTLNRLV